MKETNSYKNIINVLQERAKELNCLYTIEDLLNNSELSLEEVARGIIKAIPAGWQFPEFCRARLIIGDNEFLPPDFAMTKWAQKANIKVRDEIAGYLEVYYRQGYPLVDKEPFLAEEQKLLNTIADRLGHFLLHQSLKGVFEEWKKGTPENNGKPKAEWYIVLDLIRKTDQHLAAIISRKMVNMLFYKGVEESSHLLKRLGSLDIDDATLTEVNRPSKRQILENSFNLSLDIFELASKYISDDEILALIQKWVNEDKSNFLVMALANRSTQIADVSDALRKYHQTNPDSDENSPVVKGMKVALIRRFLTEQLEYINVAKNFFEIKDFYGLLQNMIFPADSHGKLGGKAAGLFLAQKIIESNPEYKELLASVKVPKTWYVVSDALMSFIYYNNLEDVIEHKYKDIDDVRREYPFIIQAFKNSHFSQEIIHGLSMALDDFGDNPIIVRSSSLLEDRMGTAFAGKYKSLFLANQGTKNQRLEALTDAIAEVYASTFGPDPIGYRNERGLLDFDEEMAIMIQEVVGTKLGKYFLPAFAGVAFSNNEFRWSPRIKREDGLIRMVPGLGTRAVDRIGEDYPIMIAPGQPALRVNLSFDDVVCYSPKNIDVINLETNTFDTMTISDLIKEIGNSFPMINEIFSIQEERHLKKPVGLGIDTRKHDIVVTFDNMFQNTVFLTQLHAILKVLADALKTPVDIEFGCNGKNLYLLQCRPQSSGSDNVSAIIPKDVAPDKIVFTANKHISNGKVPGIDYVVYVNPEAYSNLHYLEDLKEIGIIINKLNSRLPKKRFILMGPGRWGSRGDIRLGVSVTYADINNTAMLIEIARQKGNYVPDLSFGTHFFQDLVESGIRYLPLYPDNKNIIFNERFLLNSKNKLTDILPEYGRYADTVKVINVAESANGMILRVLLNADDEEAIGFLTDPSTKAFYSSSFIANTDMNFTEPWQMRMRIAEKIASLLDGDKFGVKGLYLFGTTYNKTAIANSDIDLIVHFAGNVHQKELLQAWFEGWNNSLSEMNYYQTGVRTDKILDVFYVTDDEIDTDSYYAKIIRSESGKSRRLQLLQTNI